MTKEEELAIAKCHQMGADIVKLAVRFDRTMYLLRLEQKNLMLSEDHLSGWGLEYVIVELRKTRELALPSEYKDHFKFKYDEMYPPAIWTPSEIEGVKEKARQGLATLEGK